MSRASRRQLKSTFGTVTSSLGDSQHRSGKPRCEKSIGNPKELQRKKPTVLRKTFLRGRDKSKPTNNTALTLKCFNRTANPSSQNLTPTNNKPFSQNNTRCTTPKFLSVITHPNSHDDEAWQTTAEPKTHSHNEPKLNPSKNRTTS